LLHRRTQPTHSIRTQQNRQTSEAQHSDGKPSNPRCLTGLSGCSVICAYTSSVSTSACTYI
jgi:hypothetical protein